MPITLLPAAPTRADAANFATRADAFLAALPSFAAQANAMAGAIDSATALANYRGDYQAGVTYTLGQGVSFGGFIFLAKRTVINVTPVEGDDWYRVKPATIRGAYILSASNITFNANSLTQYFVSSGFSAVKAGDGATLNWHKNFSVTGTQFALVVNAFCTDAGSVVINVYNPTSSAIVIQGISGATDPGHFHINVLKGVL